MKIESPSADLIPQLRFLWKDAFGDTDAFLDLFFSIAYDPDRCRCIRSQGRVAATLYWLDLYLNGQKYAYLYAIATATDCRGQGLCKELMADTAAHLQQAGYAGAILVPQDEGLRTMYGRMGYENASAIDEFFCAAEDSCIDLRQITAEEFAALRPAMLPEGSMDLSPEALAFLDAVARFYKGEGFLAAVSRENEHLRFLEYLGDRTILPALIAALGATEATVRAHGTSIPFTMYLPLSAQSDTPRYYPFAFD